MEHDYQTDPSAPEGSALRCTRCGNSEIFAQTVCTNAQALEEHDWKVLAADGAAITPWAPGKGRTVEVCTKCHAFKHLNPAPECAGTSTRMIVSGEVYKAVDAVCPFGWRHTAAKMNGEKVWEARLSPQRVMRVLGLQLFGVEDRRSWVNRIGLAPTHGGVISEVFFECPGAVSATYFAAGITWAQFQEAFTQGEPQALQLLTTHTEKVGGELGKLSTAPVSVRPIPYIPPLKLGQQLVIEGWGPLQSAVAWGKRLV